MAISHVNVVRDGDHLIVTWRGGAATDSVFVSEDPLDAGVDVRAPDRPGLATIRGVRAGRRVYVHLFDRERFVVAAERTVPSSGFNNLRDLGGYDCPAGSTRWGSIFRADLPSGAAAVESLERLGVVRVIDLRSERELGEEPSPVADATQIELHHLPLLSDRVQQSSQFDLIMSGELVRFDESDMAAMYVRMVRDHLKTFVRAVRLVATSPGPVMFHCAGGKDRTGLVAALILDSVGVSRSSVLDDYELTERNRDEARANRFRDELTSAGVDFDAVRVLFGARRAVMKATLEELAPAEGAGADVLRGGGLPAMDLVTLHGRLLGTDHEKP